MNRERLVRELPTLSFKLLLTIILSVFVSISAFAQETTGSVEGTITDSSGAKIPGAVVKIEGGILNKSVTTGNNGVYKFIQVPPGAYKIIVTASNFSGVTAEGVIVVVGKANVLDYALKVGSVQEQVVITSEDTARLDPTDSKVQTSITSRQIESLPKGTNFTSLLKLSPATRPEPLSGQFQVDGASGSENNFIIDGQEVGNFRMGTLNQNNNIPFIFVEEVQVKTSGFEAQYGGATGGVINLVTKSGSNQLHGEVGSQFEFDGLFAGPRQFLNQFRTGSGSGFVQINQQIKPDKDSFSNYYPSFLISGPVKKDRLWFLASYSPQYQNTTRTTKYFSSDPRTRTLRDTQAYKQRLKYEYSFFRLDAAPSDKLRLSASYTWNPIIQKGMLPVSNATGNLGQLERNISIGGAVPVVDYGPGIGVLSRRDVTDRIGGRQNSNNINTSAQYTINSKALVSTRFTRGFQNEKLNSYNLPKTTRFLCANSAPPPDAGCALGFDSAPTTNFQINFDASIRTAIDSDISYLVNNFAGNHEFKGGYLYSKITNDVDRGYVPYGITTLFYGLTINDLTPVEVTADPTAVGAGRVRRFGTLGKASNTAQSLYVQDKWQVIPRLTINAGVRLEKEDLPSFNGFAPPINFGFTDKIAPRFGVAYDLTGSGKTKLFGSYGVTNDRLKFELPRGSFGGDFFLDDYFEILPGNNYKVYTLSNIIGNNKDIIGGQCPIVDSTGLSKCQADFRIASNNPDGDIFTGRVDPNLKPFRQTEVTVGIERELSRNFLFSSRYTYKNVDHAVEDAGFPTPAGSEAYIIGNPGEGLHAETAKLFGYVKVAKPERKYHAMELRLDRRFSKGYQFQTAYTYSRLRGNYSGLASSDENGRTSPGVNRFFDLPFVGFNANGKPDNGPLATDRPHVFNVNGSYDYKWFGQSRQTTKFGLFSTIQSGTPLTTLFSFYGVTTILNGRGDLGRTPAFTQTDFSVAHEFKITETYNVGFNFNLINIFNESNVLRVQNSIVNSGTTNATNLGLPSANETEAINLLLTDGIQQKVLDFYNSTSAPQRKNTSLGMPNTYQTGREIRFGFRLRF